MRLPNWARKRWDVVDGNGNVSESYYKRKNAQVYMDEMNKWSDEFGTTFRIVRRNNGSS